MLGPMRLLLALTLCFISVVTSRSLFESDLSGLAKRQNGAGPAVGGNICARVNLQLTVTVVVAPVTVPIQEGVCLCAAGGVLTQQSLADVAASVRLNSGKIPTNVLGVTGGIDGAIALVQRQILPILLGQQTTCRDYPPNSVPNSCDTCDFGCRNDAQGTYVRCGDYCILQGASCISGVPGRRRSLQGRSPEAICGKGAEACLIPVLAGSSALITGGFECIRTAVDLESCGGCVHPLPGRPTGQDCTAIPHAASVSCEAGKCLVESCHRGYITNNEQSACRLADHDQKGNTKLLKGYWAALADSAGLVLTQ